MSAPRTVNARRPSDPSPGGPSARLDLADMIGKVHIGDCLGWLRQLPDDWANCCITSPPYWGLRDYGTARWDGGEPNCDHVEQRIRTRRNLAVAAEACDGHKRPQANRADDGGLPIQYKGECGKCGAVRVDQQLGLEPTPEEYVGRMVEVFREVRRVLREDGVLWLNVGDSYAGSGQGWCKDHIAAGPKQATNKGTQSWDRSPDTLGGHPPNYISSRQENGLKPKDLVGIPWMLAFALRADGWYLRSAIVWAKGLSFVPHYGGSCMPESCQDRPTSGYEMVFLLSKSERYWYDGDAAREPAVCAGDNRGGRQDSRRGQDMNSVSGATGASRNLRNVWAISPEPSTQGHFATYPTRLVATCMQLGCPPRVCAECGKPWARKVETSGGSIGEGDWIDKSAQHEKGMSSPAKSKNSSKDGTYRRRDLGFFPSCECGGETRPGLVLDPFTGSGTTGVVAVRHRRRFAGCELNPDYVAMAQGRIDSEAQQQHLDLGGGA